MTETATYQTHAAQAAHQAAWTRDTYQRATDNEVLNAFADHLQELRRLARRQFELGRRRHTPDDLADMLRRTCDLAATDLQKEETP